MLIWKETGIGLNAIELYTMMGSFSSSVYQRTENWLAMLLLS